MDVPGEVSRFKDLLPWCEGQGSFYLSKKIYRCNQRSKVLSFRTHVVAVELVRRDTRP